MWFWALSAAEVSQEREIEGDVLQADMGAGMPFRPGTFDGVIRWNPMPGLSRGQISVLICNTVSGWLSG